MPDSSQTISTITQTFTATAAIQGIVLGMMLGATGQGVRAVIGLKKAADSARAAGSTLKEEFNGAQLLVSLFIGAIAGAVASIPLLSQLGALSYQTVLGLLGAGYAGADFVEGFVNKAFPAAQNPGATPGIQAGTAPASQATAAIQASATRTIAPLIGTTAVAGTTPIWTVGSIPVFQEPDGRVHWQSKADVDADGSNGQNGKPFAYREDDTGLDLDKNAGWPDGDWTNVLVNDGGRPKDDGNGNWYSMTAYEWSGRQLANQYVDATTVPYVVVNPNVRIKAEGIVLGCRARITWRGVSVDAVVADVSGPKDIGEISIAAAEALHFPNSSPRNGGVGGGVLFEFWPGIPAVINGETYQLIPA